VVTISAAGVYDSGGTMQEDPRQEAQYDPRNKRSASVKRIRWSFVVIVLIFLALSITAVKIWTHTP
jgi:hypothetical protein